MPFGLGLLSGLGFGVSALIMRRSGLAPWPMAVFAGFGSALTVLPVAFFQQWNLISNGAKLTGLLGGVVNGLGLVFLSMLLSGAAQQKWNLTSYGTLPYLVPPVIVIFGSVWFFRDSFNAHHVAGFLVALGGVYWMLSH